MTKRASKFNVAPMWSLLLQDMQINPSSVLAHAQLPADLFSRPGITLSPAEYFQLWRGIEKASEGREVALLLAEHFSAEAFDVPIFASLCSPNLSVAVKRLSHYKPLIGPMVLDVQENDQQLSLSIDCYDHPDTLPQPLALCELVFFTQLARMASRHPIKPIAIQLPELPSKLRPYTDYFGCPLSLADKVTICFSLEDAKRPFLTANASMWDFFEGNLNKKLADLNTSATTTERVRALLIEALPSGESSAEYIADKLAMSKRTLQRKLTQEAETFQSLLIQVRSELAIHYLEKSDISLGEISFLLGFQETNSFIRSFNSWKGVSPGSYREQQRTH